MYQAASNKVPKNTSELIVSCLCAHKTGLSLELGEFLMLDWFIGQY